MRYMKSVNKLLESVREFRKEIQRGEAGTVKETATEAMMYEELDRHLRYQVECCALYDWLNGKTDKKPPIADRILERLSKSPRQCTCVSGVVGDDCPLHGKSAWPKKAGECTCKVCNQIVSGKHVCITPDLPLHVKVAKANKKHVMNGDIGWVYFEDNMPYPIPDYPNDLVAAMGVLEEYCRKYNIYSEINLYGKQPPLYFCALKEYITTECVASEKSQFLPQAICLAIVAHSEAE